MSLKLDTWIKVITLMLTFLIAFGAVLNHSYDTRAMANTAVDDVTDHTEIDREQTEKMQQRFEQMIRELSVKHDMSSVQLLAKIENVDTLLRQVQIDLAVVMDAVKKLEKE